MVNGVREGNRHHPRKLPDPAIPGGDQDIADMILQLAKEPPGSFKIAGRN